MQYEKTSGYRNWLNRRCWLPFIRNGIAHMKSGARYLVEENGWKRIKEQGNGIQPQQRQ